ncbi:Regulatory protein brlA [Penicillium subrubescens]|uniref:Regulatory protein brlA n=1 Tax=Penicillium subrubescens TaxID=1316194 RepID=A0A1Q5TGP3_9EURO|nr:Regulatory protein brlA [Penicillium subrubescens]
MHSQVKTAPPSAENRDYHTEWNLSYPSQGPYQWPILQAGHSPVAVHWIGFLGNIWPSMEFSIYASAQQAQPQDLNWSKDDTDQKPGVQFFARNPTAESLGVTMLNRSDIALFGETPDSEWRTTSWHDFEEFTRPICGNQGYSSRSRNSIPWQIQRRQFKCSVAGCKGRFRYFKGLQRHLSGHLAGKPHFCWVPGFRRSFSRRDNLKAHYATHGKHGGRNRYVATLDRTSSAYDPCFRGQLTSDGWPAREANMGLPDI